MSDFYAAYNHYSGPKQRCWAHLLRDLHELTQSCPKDVKLGLWAKGIKRIYVQANTAITLEDTHRERAKLELEQKLLTYCKNSSGRSVSGAKQTL